MPLLRWITGALVLGLAVMPLWAAQDAPAEGATTTQTTEGGPAEGDSAGSDTASAGESAGKQVGTRPGFEVPRAGVSGEWALLDALSREVPGAESVPLGDAGQPAPAMYWPAVARKNEGGALVLATVGGDIARHGLAQQLAAHLPEAGWHTLTTVMTAPVPKVPERVLPARRDPSPRGSESTGTEGSSEAGAGASDGKAPAAQSSDAAEGGASTAGTAGNAQAGSNKPVDIDVVQGEGPAAKKSEAAAGDQGALAEASAEAAAEDTGAPAQAQALDNPTRLALALDELNRRGFQNNAVIAEGGEVSDVLAWLVSLPDIPPKGLVLILVNAPLDSWAGWLEKQPALRQLAVLDIWDRDQSLLDRQAALRLKSARRAGFRRYDVYPVSAPGLPGGQARLARKIVHWLRTVAPGEDRAVSAGGGA